LRKRRNQPLTGLADLLPRLAREQGAERLSVAVLEAGVRRALGDWLGGRLLSCHRDGPTLSLEIAGDSAAREAEALSAEVLAALRRRLGAAAPKRLRVIVGRSPARRRRAGADGHESAPAPGPAAEEALAGIEDPDLRAQLARIVGRGTDRST